MPSLELIVVQININPGYNDMLLASCPTLLGYVQFVEKIRTYQKNLSLNDAVNQAVNDCIREGILVDFLSKNKAEVVSMSLFEYNKELHEKTMIEIGREEGLSQGLVTERIRIIISLVKKDYKLQQIADILDEPEETITTLYETVLHYAPDYNPDLILEDILQKNR